MPYTGGQIQSAQAEAAAMRKRKELQVHLRNMEERYQRHVQAGTAHHPAAKYLKKLIEDARRTLRGR